LRQFVQAKLPQESSHSGDPRIVLEFEITLKLRVQIGIRSQDRIRVPHHSSEFESVKLTGLANDAPAVNDWPTIVKDDKQADDDEDWREQNDQKASTHKIDAALGRLLKLQVSRSADILSTGTVFKSSLKSKHEWVPRQSSQERLTQGNHCAGEKSFCP